MLPSSPLAVLRHRDFRLYWSGQAVSLVGTWMQIMAQGWVLTSLSSSASVLGLFNLVGSLPMLLLGMKGGEIADRRDKRTVLLVTQVAMMLLAFAFSGLIYSGYLVLWHIFAFSLVVSVVEAFEFPASQGLAPELVDGGQIPHAVAMMQAIFHTGRLVGPAAAGILIQSFGEASAFLANGLSFLAVIATLMLIPPRRPTIAPAGSARSDFRIAFQYVRDDVVAGRLLALIMLALVFIFPYLVLIPHYARRVLEADAEGLGNLLSGTGVGALGGALLLLVVAPSTWRARLWFACSVSGAALVGMALNRSLAGGIVLAAALSFSTSVLMGTVSQTVQERVPPELRGRVTALYGMAFTSVLPVASLAIGALADVTGITVLMHVSALLALACGYAVLGALRRALKETK